MNFLAFSILLAHFIWSLIHHNTLFYLYLLIIIIYTVINYTHSTKFRNTFRRKMQIATWSDGGNPRVFGREPVDWTHIKEVLAKNAKKDAKTFPRAVVFAKAFAVALKSIKKSLGKITFGTFVIFPSVDVSVQVRIKKGEIAWVLLRDCDKKSIRELAQEYELEAEKLKKGKHVAHNFHTQLFDKLPAFLVQLGMRIAMFFANDCGLDLAFLKLEKHPFGILSIADISESGVADSFGALNPLMKCAINVQLGMPVERAVAVGEKVEVREIMYYNVVFDHRFADGTDGAKMMKELKEFLNNLDKHLAE